MLGRSRSLCVLLALAPLLFAVPPSAFAQRMEESSVALPARALVFSPLYIAEAAGLWEKHGLKVKLVDITGIGAMNAVLAKSVDFSSSSGATIIRAHIRGQKVLGLGNTLDGLAIEIVLRKDVAEAAGVDENSPIEKRAQALKGKKASTTSVNTIPHAHLRYFARKGGVDPEREITVVSNLAEAGLAALKNGAVEAYVQGPPWGPTAVQQGIGVRLSSPLRGDLPELAPQAYNIIVTRPDVCEERPSVCTKMMAGIGDALVLMHDKPQDAIAHLRKYMPNIDPRVFAESYDLIRRWTPRSAKVKEQGLVNAQQLMLVGGMLRPGEKLAAFKDIYTDKFTK